MANRIPLIVNAGAAQIQELAATDALSVIGNIIAGNVIVTTASTAASYSASGNINGANIIASAAMSAASVSASGNITGGNLNAAGLSLSSNVVSALNVTSNIAGGNITTPGIISSTGNITSAANISGGNILGGANVNATTHTGTTVSVSGNINGGNIISAAALSATSLSLSGASQAASYSASGNVTAANVIVNGTAAAGSAVLIVSGNIQTTAANNTANIGNVTNYFNTVHAKATTAQYADLAEWYVADNNYPPGTVLSFGGDQEVTLSVSVNDQRVAGVVSTNPAHIMNSGLKAPHVAAVALTGRVPTLVIGEVKKGDMMVTAGGGRAMSCATPTIGTVIGKSLQDHTGGSGTIEIVVGRL